ncbi:hypothetical protein NEMBOFW57_008426 [Staphylotrichum longicolle]|uniref:glucan 1,3-beta-glucosidase n=1 Tax=Staphylotrichum longicolle TaxID=669026 RepID=A0AAD4ERA9_9PEZI|nr:hypothetical protein NEMBOFW57_008426 [Staphylotrichum longicolle]
MPRSPSRTRPSRSRPRSPSAHNRSRSHTRHHHRRNSSSAAAAEDAAAYQHQRRKKRRPSTSAGAGAGGGSYYQNASTSESTGGDSSQVLSAAALARLNRENAHAPSPRSGGGGQGARRERTRERIGEGGILIGVCSLLLLIIIIVAAVVVPKMGSGEQKRDEGGSDDKGGLSSSNVPPGAPSWLNPLVWQDTADFNLTYTDATVGDLPLMGLKTSWDDSAKANDHVPALNEPWGDYAKRPARGVNVGGWLSLEPFITPSLFNYALNLGIVDEYSLCKYLASKCESVLEKHYATFVTEDTFRQIRDAGLDHVRIPFSYWAVQTYDGDPYLFRTSWRYLLRAIEWCRRYGLRVNLDVHGLPGSQNGWNHSGRLGPLNWLNGTDGALNAKRSLEVHDRLSKFFAQPRYKNIISHYGLANEPKMTVLPSQDVLQWTEDAYALVRKNGVTDAIVVFGDGFRGLHNWQGELTNLDNAALDVHQYVIFNTNQIVFNHTAKIRYACAGWTEQTLQSMDARRVRPTLVAEVAGRHRLRPASDQRRLGQPLDGHAGDGGRRDDAALPGQGQDVQLRRANAPASRWSSSYKQFLKMFAEAQMSSSRRAGLVLLGVDTEDA